MKEAWFLVSSFAASKLIRLYSNRFTIEESYRDFKDNRFGLNMDDTHIKQGVEICLLIPPAIANMLLTFLVAAGENLDYARLLKVKKRTHSPGHTLFWQIT